MLFMHSWSLRDLNIFTVALVISFLLLRWSTIKTYSFLFQSRSHGKGLAGTTNTEYLHVTLANTTPIKSCLDPDGPQPLIPMSLGRSGSGSTHQIIGNLTGMETPSEEYTGKTPAQSRRFFRNIQNDHGLWVTDNLCKKQQRYSRAGLIGFNWKPWKSIFSDPALDGLRLISNSQNPTVMEI